MANSKTEGVNEAAVEEFRDALRPVVRQAEREGVPPSQQAAIFAHLAYAQFQRSDHLDFAFEQWVARQRAHADESQMLEGFLYAMEDASDRDPRLLRNAAEIPRADGRIPWHTYDDRPPETVLDAYWKCPHCRETMPTLYDLWRYEQNKNRCLAEQDEYEYGTTEWHAYQEGVKHYTRRIEDLTAGLDNATRQWAMEVVRDVF